MSSDSREPSLPVDISAFLPHDLVRRTARAEALERLARLPIETTLRYAALCAWERAVGLTVDRWEVEVVVLGWWSYNRASR